MQRCWMIFPPITPKGGMIWNGIRGRVEPAAENISGPRGCCAARLDGSNGFRIEREGNMDEW